MKEEIKKQVMECMELYIQNEYDEILKICNRSIKKWPNEAEFFHYRALVFIKKENLTEAKSNFVQAFELQKEWGYFNNLFIHLLRMNLREDALRILKAYFCMFKMSEKIHIAKMINEQIDLDLIKYSEVVTGLSERNVLNLQEFRLLFEKLREPNTLHPLQPFIDMGDFFGED